MANSTEIELEEINNLVDLEALKHRLIYYQEQQVKFSQLASVTKSRIVELRGPGTFSDPLCDECLDGLGCSQRCATRGEWNP